MKILIMTDSMFLPTGLAKVGRELAIGLSARGHQIGYIGWWHRPEITVNVPPQINYWFTNNGHYGADVLDSIVSYFRPEVVLTIGDMWNLAYITDPNRCRTRRLFQWCSYIAVDGEPKNGGIPPDLIPIIEEVDIPIAYTDYAKNAILKSCRDPETRMRVRTIYHGVETELYRPLPWAERKKLRTALGIDDKFMVLCVARNQSRKNIPETFDAWKTFSELPEIKDQAVLWPHMYFNDPMGWKIDSLINVLQLRNKSIKYYTEMAYAPSELQLIPEARVAELYQAADAFILLSGEGFGLPTIEAMATKVPCILLDYAASSELGAEGRAELVPVGGSMTWTGLHLTQRPIPQPGKVVDALVKIYRDRSYREIMAQKAYDFAIKYTWENVAEEWNQLFLSQEIPFIKPLELEVVA